ncbi:MAG: phage tail tape measure protein, partial [Ruminococcus sp.]|nr:phage tail tape measure protein [Ruminococcus sp.]
MDALEEGVGDGMEKANKTAEQKSGEFSAIFRNAVDLAGQALQGLADKSKDIFVNMLTAGDEYNQAMNQLSASTGATGEELESLKDIAKGVFANKYGESYEDVANAVADVRKNLGEVSDEELKTVTESAFALRDVFEYDIGESTRAVKAMVENFGISGENAMSLIAAGSQNGLDYSGELLDSISEYSVQFAKLGLGADDMFKIFNSGAENGAWNLDKIGDAVKEFSIRAIDGSTTTAEGFSALGMDADEMALKFANGGESAKTAFQETVSAIVSMEDPVARDAAGVALFGTMWEDLGVEAVASLGRIEGGAYDAENAMNAIKSVKYDDIGNALEGLRRTVGNLTIDAKADFSAGIAGAIGTLVNALNSANVDISVIFAGLVG